MPATKITINPDLANERQKCTFDVEELARYWAGDQAKLDDKRARGTFFFCLLPIYSIYFVDLLVDVNRIVKREEVDSWREKREKGVTGSLISYI